MSNITENTDTSPTTNRSKKDAIILFYHPDCCLSQMAIMALYYYKMDFLLHRVNPYDGEQYEPWFLDISPKGEIPVLKGPGTQIVLGVHKIIQTIDQMKLFHHDLESKSGREQKRFLDMIHGIKIEEFTAGALIHADLALEPRLPLEWRKKRTEILTNFDKVAEQRLQKPGLSQLAKQSIQDASKQAEYLLSVVQSREKFVAILKTIQQTLLKLEKCFVDEGRLQDKNKQNAPWLINGDFSTTDMELIIVLYNLRVVGLWHLFDNGKINSIKEYYARAKRYCFVDPALFRKSVALPKKTVYSG